MVFNTLAKNLRVFRTNAKLTIYDAGKAIGKSGKTISAWENGRGQPNADELVMLCALYNVPTIGRFYGEMVTPNLADEEIAIVSKFRSLNEEGRAFVVTAIALACDRFGDQDLELRALTDLELK